MSSLKINSNIASLNAQRNFGTATKKLSESYTRLSSGLRINKASDDAAGLAISELLKADTRIYNQGVRNLNDGVSMLSIADGALGELSSITTRLQELATQSANGTLSNRQRYALDAEAQSLAKEYNRIARSAEFNGRKMLNGDFGNLSLAAGGGRSTLIESSLGGLAGDGSFGARVSYVTGVGSSGVANGDFNGDGFEDLVSADASSDTISVVLGNGDGTFKSRSIFAAGASSTPNGIDILDVNNDGFGDLVTTDQNGSSISVYTGNGDGSFKARVSFASGVAPFSAEAADFNNDGKIDIAFAEYGVNSFSVMLGNGDGSFKARTSYATNANPASLEVADFNSDGILDVATADSAHHVITFYNGVGNGTFTGRLSIATNGSGPTALTVGDFNGDGRTDLAVGYSSGPINIFQQTSSGTMSQGALISPYSGGASITELETGDFNGDGILDLAASDGANGRMEIFIGSGNATFKTGDRFYVGSGNELAVGDLNRDGVLDIFGADGGGAQVSVYLGNTTSGVSNLYDFSLTSRYDAKRAMTYFQGVLERISKHRGQVGAVQSRVDVAISTLQTASLNYSDASSRITDVDVAEESSRLTAGQILQQSATSVLSQANLQPRLVLELLANI